MCVAPAAQALGAPAGGPGAPATPDGTSPSASAASPIDVLNERARPLSDLDALAEMVGDAQVVGLGEASHSGHEFFTLKERVFRHLVTTKGFTTFALETSWGAGVRLDDYVVHGIGDPEEIMREEFQGQYVFWNTAEYLDLIRWMRAYNATAPEGGELRFVGNDLGFPGRTAFARVRDYATAHRPDLRAEIDRLYAGLEPASGVQAGAWMGAQLAKDVKVRAAEASRARAVAELLRAHGAPEAGGAAGERDYTWAVQHATAIEQSFTGYAFSDEEFPQRMRYRDQVMAANTEWWLRNGGGRTLLASNNGHVAYVSDDPEEFPKPVGAFLRERLGGRYVSVGLTFGRGSVNALPDFTAQRPQTYRVAPAPKGHNEYLLGQVRHGDFALDLRDTPEPARSWLATSRPTRSYGLYNSAHDPQTALGRSYDVLIHLRQVQAGRLR
jgi:erythromycin esterase